MPIQRMIAQWLESTAAGVLVRESEWGFSILVAIHIIGLTVSVGMVIWFDLRLLGVALCASPVSRVYRQIIPWAGTGFVLMFLSGGMLLTGYAVPAFGNAYFRIKMAALLAAGLNALAYHRFTERQIADWNDAAKPPAPARMAGLISIIVWATAILCGRMMSYTIF
jgi:hypothetical protein